MAASLRSLAHRPQTVRREPPVDVPAAEKPRLSAYAQCPAHELTLADAC